jgi:hypothetical protein
MISTTWMPVLQEPVWAADRRVASRVTSTDPPAPVQALL